MTAPVFESDHGGPFNREPLKNDPPGNDPLKSAPQRSVARPSPSAEAMPEPLRKPRARREVFEGDAAVIELRSSLARARSAASQPEPPRAGDASVPKSRNRLRAMGLLLVAAAAAGAAGYLLGNSRPVTRPADIARASGEANATPASATRLADVRAPGAESRVPADARRADTPTAAPSSPRTARPPAMDASEIAARMKIGNGLLAAGDIAAARTMFERVAEAGEAAGAFALAETYDLAVLSTLPFMGGVTPDPAQARRWYEKANAMGSAAAPERIARLPGR